MLKSPHTTMRLLTANTDLISEKKLSTKFEEEEGGLQQLQNATEEGSWHPEIEIHKDSKDDSVDYTESRDETVRGDLTYTATPPLVLVVCTSCVY